MNNATNHPFYIKATTILLGIIALVYILSIGQAIFVPLIFALFLAILLNPLVNFFIRKKVHRLIAIFLAVLAAIIVIGTLLFLIHIHSLKQNLMPPVQIFYTGVRRNLMWMYHR
jgi:predicted PurR-regulated permease PerM